MDSNQFDRALRLLTTAPSRRQALGGVLGALLSGVLGGASQVSVAKGKKGKGGKGKAKTKKKQNPPPTPASPPPRPPAPPPTCSEICGDICDFCFRRASGATTCTGGGVGDCTGCTRDSECTDPARPFCITGYTNRRSGETVTLCPGGIGACYKLDNCAP